MPATVRTLRETEEMHRLLFECVPHPRFVCDGKTLRILAANEAAIRQYGYPRDQLLKMKVTTLCVPESAAGFRQWLRRLCKRPAAGPRRTEQVFRHQRRDGKMFDVKIDMSVMPQRRRVFLLMTENVTERHRAEQRMRVQQAVTQALAESSTLTEAGPKVFRALCERLGCDWGELWRVDPSVRMLRCMQVWHPGRTQLAEIERYTRSLLLARGSGIAGTVWQRNRPLWIRDLVGQAQFQRATVMARRGLRAVWAFPIRLNKEVLGVITIFTRRPQPPDKHLLRLFRDICSQIGQVMGRRRAERQLLEISEREQQRIGQDLHDGLCQQLTGVAYMASDLESRLGKRNLPETKIAARVAQIARETAVQARQVARGLNPVKVGTIGLVAALGELTASIQSMFSIVCRFECPHRIWIRDHETAVHLYRIAQEGIHNAITHGGATRIVVSLRRAKKKLWLLVSDNGRGLHKNSSGGGMGLENMNYRARAIGAQLSFSKAPDGGTILTCEYAGREGGTT